MRSFGSALALRVALQALGLAAVAVVGATLTLRVYLLSSIDASLREVAEVEAESGASALDAKFHFRPESFPPLERDPTPEFSPWAQVLSLDGTPEVRSGNLSTPLPVPPQALAAAIRGQIGVASHQFHGHALRSLIYPLTRTGPTHVGHLLQVSASLVPMQTTLRTFAQFMVLFGVLGTGVAWLAAWQIAGRALKPALAITSEAESIGVNELGRRVTVPGAMMEFDRMAVAYNSLLARIEGAVVGTRRFTSDASHELRAPFTVLRGELELALSRPRTPGEYEQVLRRCLDEVLRLVRLADDMLTLTRVEGGVVGSKRVATDLDDVVERARGKKAGLAAARGVAIEVSGTAGLVAGDGDLLLRAIDCLLEHAIMATPSGGRVRVRLLDGEHRSIEVTDGGSGLKRDEISGVFQRFYRSNRPRAASSESGLGLPIARAVALSHGGTLDYVGNDPGASFRLNLPRA